MAKKQDNTTPETKPEKKKSNIFVDGIKFITGLFFKKMAEGGAAELRENREEVDQLNVFPVPDGDTGHNMSETIDSGVAALENVDTDNIAEVSMALSQGMLFGARGNSGVILSQFFSGISQGLQNVDKADPITFGHALELGVERAYASVNTPTEGTILTVAREAVEYAVSRINSKSTLKSLFNDLVKEMHASLNRTPELLAALKDAGVVDSGAAGLFYIMDGFNRVLGGEEIKSALPEERPAPIKVLGTSFNQDSDMPYGYCTEMLVQLTTKKCNPESFDLNALKKFLSSLGDSIVAFVDGSIVKLHVHTFTPDKVIGYMLGFGELITIKIENMSIQHTETLTETKQETPTEELPRKKNAYVAVCIGEGIENIYRELGVDIIIRGGQTQNPSTNDFLDAFKKVNAEHIYVFPNNGNIIMAAEQAAEMYEDADVTVFKSKSLGLCYSVLASIDPEGEKEDIVATFNEVSERVTTAYISPSIRDTQIEGVNIKDGDTMGIIGKEIVVSIEDRAKAAVALADALLTKEGTFMLTIFYGVDVDEEEMATVEAKIREMHPDVELYITNGMQEVYPYLYVAE